MARVEASMSGKKKRFFVTRESQNTMPQAADSDKLSYVGMRNLSDLDLIDEQDIVSARGTVRGRKNRVRAGLANFENPKALEKLNAERGKVVVYVTSFRGVRSTFEDCRYVLDLFHKLRVRIVTKDIYVYRLFHKELEERLRQSGHLNVPQVFIGGQHVGGKTELEELNEVGELRKILDGYPRYETANDCKVCGGFEFIPCRKCGGSKNSRANKFTTEFRALRCTHCNEDGMEECPHCEERRREIEEELAKKKLQNLTSKTNPSKLEDHNIGSNRDEDTVENETGLKRTINLETDMETEAQIENKISEQIAGILKEVSVIVDPEEQEKDHFENDDVILSDKIPVSSGGKGPEEEEGIDENGVLDGEDVEEIDKEGRNEEALKLREVEDEKEEEEEPEDALEGETIEKKKEVVLDNEEDVDAATLTQYIRDLDIVQF